MCYIFSKDHIYIQVLPLERVCHQTGSSNFIICQGRILVYINATIQLKYIQHALSMLTIEYSLMDIITIFEFNSSNLTNLCTWVPMDLIQAFAFILDTVNFRLVVQERVIQPRN